MHDVLLIPVLEAPMPALVPVFSCRVPAGFPSPATDELERLFDLNRLLFRPPDATYLVRVSGKSMSGAEIYAGDLLAVDKHREADHGHIVVAVVDGDCTVKRLERRGGNVMAGAGESGGFVGGGVCLLGFIPVKQFPAEALAAHGSG